MNSLSSLGSADRADQNPNAGIPARDVSQVRLICRHASELLLLRSERWTPLWPSERMAGLVIETTLSATTAHLPYCDPLPEPSWIGLDAALDAARPLSVLAMARSLKLPYGSIARRVEQLVAADLLIKESRGVRVSPRFLSGDRPIGITEANKAELRRILGQLQAAGYAPAPDLLGPAFDQIPAMVVERAIIAFSLRVLEGVTHRYGDAINGLLAANIIAFNVHHLTQDPVLSQRFAAEDAPPPDELRQPIPVRVLARMIGMPFETVRRRVNDLRDEGVVVILDEGVILPAEVLLSPKHLSDNRRIVQHFEQMLKLLTALTAPYR